MSLPQKEVALHSVTELKIADIWMEVLGLQNELLDVDTNFLDLGGDSLSALLCVSRFRNKFGPDLDTDLSDFFDQNSTIRNLAKSIDQSNSTELIDA